MTSTIHTSTIPYDVESVRQNFPALRGERIPLNNATGSLVYEGAVKAIASAMSTYQLDFIGGDRTSQLVVDERKSKYIELAAFLNAEPDEIAFGPSTSGLIRNVTTSLRPLLNSDSEMIVSTLCHESGVTSWVALARSLGIEIKWWSPPGGKGNNTAKLSIETLKPLLSPKTRLVACGHVSNIFGTIHDIRAVADLVHTIPGALLSVDGVAWAPHRPIDVKALDVDFYFISWYKLFGPHFGQVYARRSVQQRHMTSLNLYHLDPTPLDVKVRLGTSCFEFEDGVLEIVRYLQRIGWDNIITHEAVIVQPLLEYLNSHPEWFTLYGEKSSDPKLRVALVSFTVKGVSSMVIAKIIHESSPCRILAGNAYSLRPVHDVLGLGDGGVLRVSLVHYNTVQDVQTFIDVLDHVVQAHFTDQA
ncbi:putative aminotransferase [Plenodomus tracheiphilus IPT5]|uniref:Putative aminotransferase n=1 Tax=Plenodomus tracheiphilus IPT5 TaxID=1408161 RepID=A0A6A7AMG3_9PLEO|nr:putative aminotransferase [Plenodomus tracheiphilus IPT5]